MGVLTLVLGFFIFPLSEAYYIMKSTKRMFLAKTKDDNLFEKQDKARGIGEFLDKQRIPDTISDTIMKEIVQHRIIKLKSKDKFCFVLNHVISALGFCSCFKICWRNGKKLSKILDEAQDRIHQELDIIKMLRHIRDHRVLL